MNGDRSARDFIEGSSRSGFRVRLTGVFITTFDLSNTSFGTCLILGHNQKCKFSYSIGSIVQWNSQFAMHKSSTKIE